MGSSHGSIWHGRVREGRAQWIMGSWPPFVLASVASRLIRYPVLTGSLAMLWGYLSSAPKKIARYEEPEFRRFLRRYQRWSLLLGKRAAARKMTDERAGRWEAAHGASAAADPAAARALGRS
jgi:poly-beta-1,6-N-acetyl-D-glucosamine synthase